MGAPENEMDGWDGEEEHQDALQEADKLLKQLDLLSD